MSLRLPGSECIRPIGWVFCGGSTTPTCYCLLGKRMRRVMATGASHGTAPSLWPRTTIGTGRFARANRAFRWKTASKQSGALLPHGNQTCEKELGPTVDWIFEKDDLDKLYHKCAPSCEHALTTPAGPAISVVVLEDTQALV